MPDKPISQEYKLSVWQRRAIPVDDESHLVQLTETGNIDHHLIDIYTRGMESSPSVYKWTIS
jgi:hypothetical protein